MEADKENLSRSFTYIESIQEGRPGSALRDSWAPRISPGMAERERLPLSLAATRIWSAVLTAAETGPLNGSRHSQSRASTQSHAPPRRPRGSRTTSPLRHAKTKPRGRSQREASREGGRSRTALGEAQNSAMLSGVFHLILESVLSFQLHFGFRQFIKVEQTRRKMTEYGRQSPKT